MGKVRQWLQRLLGLDVLVGEVKAAQEGLDLDVEQLQDAVSSLEGVQIRMDVRIDQLERARYALHESVADLRNQIARLDSHVRRRFSVHGWRQCVHCQGDGLVCILTDRRNGDTAQIKCPECDGLGYVLPKPEPSEAS